MRQAYGRGGQNFVTQLRDGLSTGHRASAYARRNCRPLRIRKRSESSPWPICRNAPNQGGLLHGLIWPEAGFASIASDATAHHDFLPLAAALPFLAKQQSHSCAVLR
jgi:hypothetical protein